MAMNPSRPSRRRRANGDSRNAIVAAAEALSERLAKRGGSGGAIGDPLAEEIWNWYDLIPEARTACRITGRAMGQCRLVMARLSSEGEPAPLDFSLDENGEPNNKEDYDHPSRLMLAAFAGGQMGQSELLDAIGVALTATGETILVGALDQENRDTSDDFTRMQAYSTSQVTKMSDKVVIKLDDSRTADRPLAGKSEVADDPTAVTAIRVWRPHPKFNWKPDSALRSAITPLREIAGYDAHIQATLLSRLAGAGILWVPDEIDLPGIPARDASDGEAALDPFLRYLMEVMSLAIKDRDSAAALTPILARAAREDIAAIKHMTFTTPFDAEVATNREKAVGRLGVAVDMPGELLTGYGALQHWSGALVTDDWRGGYMAELMGFACAALTYGWYYPAMVATGHGDMESDVVIWYDDSSVRTRENTGPEVQAAYDRGEISGSTLRRVLGFDESDEPTPEEFVEQIAKTMLLKNPSLAALLMPFFGVEFTPEQFEAAKAIKEILTPTAGGAGGPAGPQPGPSSDGTSYTPAASIPAQSGTQAAPTSRIAPSGGSQRGLAAFNSVPKK